MAQISDVVTHFLVRELRAMKREIEAYPSDDKLWESVPGIANPAGNLALHCAGNLQHFVGARLAGSGYVRQRDLEFTRRNASRAEVVAELDLTIGAVRLLGASTAIPAEYPDEFGGKRVETAAMLVHLAVHLGYHLGQIDYHRRITTGDSRTVDALSAKELPGTA